MTQIVGGQKLPPNFNPGGIPDRVDPRDYQFEEVGFGTPAFDWGKGYDVEALIGSKMPVKDQNGSGSCGGQAWAYYAAALEALATGTYEERSAKYIYAQTYVPPAGSMGRDNAEIFVKQGVARETALTSYNNGNPPDEAFMQRAGDITPAIREDAKLDKSSAYANVICTIDEIARAIRDNNGAILLIEGQDNGTWWSAYPKPPQTVIWRHWIYACKARRDGGKKYIGFINSWGKGVGEQGIQWLGEEWFTTRHITQAWTHIYSPVVPPSFHYNFVVNLKYGTTHVDIQGLQTALQFEGFFPKNVPTTQYYGELTRKAVLAFRVKYGISSSTDPMGKSCGPLTRAKLNNIFS